MASKSGRGAQGGTRSDAESLSRKLNEVFSRPLQSLDGPSDEVNEIFLELHRLDIPEEKKLRYKDQMLVTSIEIFRRAVRADLAAGNLTITVASGFLLVANLFDAVENILFELKKLPGDPPKPDLPPEPKPTPTPGPSPGPKPPPKPIETGARKRRR